MNVSRAPGVPCGSGFGQDVGVAMTVMVLGWMLVICDGILELWDGMWSMWVIRDRTLLILMRLDRCCAAWVMLNRVFMLCDRILITMFRGRMLVMCYCRVGCLWSW